MCGERSDDLTDDIKFLRPKGLPTRIVRCIWLIQTFSFSIQKFYFTDFILNSSCDKGFVEVYNGLDVRNATEKHRFCGGTSPSGILQLKGPYITVYVMGNATLLENQGFQLIYGPNITSKFYVNNIYLSSPIFNCIINHLLNSCL